MFRPLALAAALAAGPAQLPAQLPVIPLNDFARASQVSAGYAPGELHAYLRGAFEVIAISRDDSAGALACLLDAKRAIVRRAGAAYAAARAEGRDPLFLGLVMRPALEHCPDRPL